MTSYKRISAADAHALMENNNEVNVVDIRDVTSFNGGHIVDAEHIDNHSIAQYINDAELDEPLVVCCYHGNSSQPAAAYLAEQGFSEVYSLDGGYEAFSSSYPEKCEKE